MSKRNNITQTLNQPKKTYKMSQAQTDLQKTQATVYDMANRRQHVEQQMKQVFTHAQETLNRPIHASSSFNNNNNNNNNAMSEAQLATLQSSIEQLSSRIETLNSVLSSEIDRINQAFIDTNANIEARSDYIVRAIAELSMKLNNNNNNSDV